MLEIKINQPNFLHHFIEAIFHQDYRAIRAWPATGSRSIKNKVPYEMKTFMQTYIANHIRDKMDEGTFIRG